jgi:type I restriction enzyme M protein
VIDMCVKMRNPQESEYTIDTAAGSSGFPVHTIFHVWRQILVDEGLQASHLFSLEDKPPRCNEYVEDKVFAIDFDEKAVRVARTLNLIAGDGQTNVLHLNTLDYELWDEVTNQDDWKDTYHEGFKRLKRLRPKGSKDYREFQFDVLMANPPFAGDIKEPRMIARYDLAKKPDGKWQTKVGRDILFIERNLDFLKPGGRMAIVLPQGRFNNSSDKNIRDFIAARCRILAVVGLHGNTFKPHTGTKTSVLFVQKWNDDPTVGALCPRQDDYNIFFATMQKSGKDNSGEKIYRRIVPKEEEGLPEQEKERKFLLDPHDHLIVDHDLYNHEGLTEDGIAEAFVEFAKKEKFSFFEQSLSMTPFDAVRYQQLMDRLEASELSWNEILDNNIYFRIDSEYYYKRFVKADKVTRKKNHQKISEFATVTDGEHGSPDLDENSGIMYLSGQNVKDNFLDISGTQQYCSERLHKKNLRSSIKVGNVLISIVGTVGNASVVYKDFTGNTDRNVATIKNIDSSFSPYFISTFLNSYYGRSQTERLSTGNVQPLLNLLQVKSILLPTLEDKFQITIKKLVKTAHSSQSTSSNFYQQAEDLLLSELGLKDWQSTEKSFAIKSFSESFLSSDRLDAEYYQPKFDQLIERLKEKVELTPLRDLLTLNQKGRQPDYIEEDGNSAGCLPVINSKYVRTGDVILSDNRYASFPEYDRPLIIKKNDVLFNGTGVGTVGRCATYFHEQEALPDTEVAVMRSDILDPVYLSIYINSIAGQFQVQKHLQGSSGIIRVYPSDTNQFLVWNAPKAIQQEIRSKVETSHQKRERSKQLLEIAKIGVERAIETDEATATDWINLQLAALGVSLTSPIPPVHETRKRS